MPKVKRIICQLVHGLPVGGTEVLVERFVRCFAEDYRVIVACMDQVGELGERLASDGFEVELLQRRPGFDWRCVSRIARLLRKARVDILHAQQYTPFAYAMATRLLGGRPRIVFTEHGRFFPDLPSRKRKIFNRFLLRRADRIIAVGRSVQHALVHNEGLPAARIEVIYNGVRQSRFDSRGDAKLVRQELDLRSEDFVVIQVARLDSIKDHETALRAVAKAKESLPHIKLLIVGDGPQKPLIENAIDQLGLRDFVCMLGMRQDVHRLLAAADVFLLSSLSEGIPVTIIEAMFSDLPVVSTNVGGVPELLEHNRTGLLAPVGADRELADSLVKLATDAPFRQGLAVAARRAAEEKFSEEKMMAAYARVYDDVIQGAIPTRRTGKLTAQKSRFSSAVPPSEGDG